MCFTITCRYVKSIYLFKKNYKKKKNNNNRRLKIMCDLIHTINKYISKCASICDLSKLKWNNYSL